MNEQEFNDAIELLQKRAEMLDIFPYMAEPDLHDATKTLLDWVRDQREMMDAAKFIGFERHEVMLEKNRWHLFRKYGSCIGDFDSPLEAFAALKSEEITR